MTNLVFANNANPTPLAKFLWKIQSLYTKKYEIELWIDDDGNTLAHYSCLHHDNQLWNFAKDKPINLKHLNKAGKAQSISR